MGTLIVGLAVIFGFLYWTDSWPFDGSYNLPRRKRGPQHRAESQPTPSKPPYS